MKRYLENLLHQCSEHSFGQDAIEWAILSGWVKLTYNLQDDVRAIMGEPNICPHCQYYNLPGDTLKCDECGLDLPTLNKPGMYDDIIDAHRQRKSELEAQTTEAMAPLLAEILRPIPKPQPFAA